MLVITIYINQASTKGDFTIEFLKTQKLQPKIDSSFQRENLRLLVTAPFAFCVITFEQLRFRLVGMVGRK
jgi:hypothetical protein